MVASTSVVQSPTTNNGAHHATTTTRTTHPNQQPFLSTNIPDPIMDSFSSAAQQQQQAQHEHVSGGSQSPSSTPSMLHLHNSPTSLASQSRRLRLKQTSPNVVSTISNNHNNNGTTTTTNTTTNHTFFGNNHHHGQNNTTWKKTKLTSTKKWNELDKESSLSSSPSIHHNPNHHPSQQHPRRTNEYDTTPSHSHHPKKTTTSISSNKVANLKKVFEAKSTSITTTAASSAPSTPSSFQKGRSFQFSPRGTPLSTTTSPHPTMSNKEEKEEETKRDTYNENNPLPSPPSMQDVQQDKPYSEIPQSMSSSPLQPKNQQQPQQRNVQKEETQNNPNQDEILIPKKNHPPNRCGIHTHTKTLSPTSKRQREKQQWKYNKVHNQSHYLDHQLYLEQQQQEQQEQQQQQQQGEEKEDANNGTTTPNHKSTSVDSSPSSPSRKLHRSCTKTTSSSSSCSPTKRKNKKKIVIQMKDGIHLLSSSSPSLSISSSPLSPSSTKNENIHYQTSSSSSNPKNATSPSSPSSSTKHSHHLFGSGGSGGKSKSSKSHHSHTSGNVGKSNSSSSPYHNDHHYNSSSIRNCTKSHHDVLENQSISGSHNHTTTTTTPQNDFSMGTPTTSSKMTSSSTPNTNSLSDRRRKMAKAKKHARSSTNHHSHIVNNHHSDKQQLFESPEVLSEQIQYHVHNNNDAEEPILTNDSTQSISNIVQASSTQSTSNRRGPHHEHSSQHQQQQQNDVSSFQKLHTNTINIAHNNEELSNDWKNDTSNHNNNNKQKIPASPSRRRKFELVKESLRQRRTNQANTSTTSSTTSHSAIESNQYNLLSFDTMTTTATTATTVSNNGDASWKQHTSSSVITSSVPRSKNKSYHPTSGSAAPTLSTASMSASTFETFDTDFNSFHHQQPQQSQQYTSSLGHLLDSVEEGYGHSQNKDGQRSLSSSIIEHQTSKSDEMTWGIDEFSPKSSRRKHMTEMQVDRIPSDQSNHHTSSQPPPPPPPPPQQKQQYNFEPFGQGSSEFIDTQNPQYITPHNVHHHTGNTWDDDDETQFNSVTENPDIGKKTNLSYQVDSQIQPLQSNTLSTKSEKSTTTSFFSTGGFVAQKAPIAGSYTFDNGVGPSTAGTANIGDDDESYTGSVGNKSWTGRMRARQAIEHNGGGMIASDNRDQVRYESPSKRSLYSIEDDNVSRFSASQLLTRDITNNAACSDATKGVEEIKRLARDDPTTTAVGIGVCGALCGALAFGPAGFVFAVGTVGACFGVSQLPQEKRDKMKKKASSSVEKIKTKTESAAYFVTSNCGCGDSTDDPPVKQIEGEFEARSLGVPISPMNGKTKGSIPKLAPPNDRVQNRKSPRKLPPNRQNPHHLEQKKPEMSALLVQASKRKLNRITPACCRMTRITPVNQIHSLDLSLHARAWLDVMASAWTSRDEKNEAMEEILLLAKDKTRARMLLEVSKYNIHGKPFD